MVILLCIEIFISVVQYTKEQKYDQAFEITADLMLAGDFSLFYNATGWTNIYNFMETSEDNPNLGRFLSKAQVRKALHVGSTEFGDSEVFGHLVNDMMVGIIQSFFSQYNCSYKPVK